MGTILLHFKSLILKRLFELVIEDLYLKGSYAAFSSYVILSEPHCLAPVSS